MFLERRTWLLLAALALLVSGCPDKKKGEPPATPTPVDSIDPSLRNVVKFKRAERLKNDFARALELAPNQVCNELGQYSCTDFVHKVALGGVSPYDLGINTPPAQTGVTTPIVVDRLALAGCVQRVDLDFANPGGAVIFRDLSVDGSGALDPDSPGVDASIARLYQNAVIRDPTPAEVTHLRELYPTVEAGSSAPARDWAVLSCFSVLTTMEALFY